MSAWDFAVAVYGRAEVKAAALALQDRGGQCVSLLLWRAWAAREGRAVEGAVVARAVEMARGVETQVLRPSRRLRRRLKAGPDPISAAARSEIGAIYLDGELAAERALIAALEALSPRPKGPAEDVLSALLETARAWGGRASPKLLARLADAC